MQEFLALFLLGFLTSVDNAIVLGGIAHQYRNLLAIGLASSLVITVCRTALIMGIVSVVHWPGLRFTLGILVLFVAISIASVKKESGRTHAPFWRVLLTVTAMDLTLSIDNILSIAVMSKNLFLIALSTFLSLVPLLMLLPVIVRVMNQVAWLRVLAAGFVAELAVDSITDDPWIVHSVPSGGSEVLFRVLAALLVISYGLWRTYAKH